MDISGREHMRKTDWTKYYENKKSWFSAYTQKFTLRIILQAMELYLDKNRAIEVLELGGGNSCFAESICKAKNIETYDIVDNNKLAVDLFNKKNLNIRHHLGIQQDLLRLEESFPVKKYDFVYSIGLIEHFRGDDVKTIIARHFKYCAKGGMVLITFPTPTRKYIFIRKCMELVGIWQFYDEKPVRYEAVKGTFEKCGNVRSHFINKRLPLSQMVVIAKNTGRREIQKKDCALELEK